jgi:hypothetical protein
MSRHAETNVMDEQRAQTLSMDDIYVVIVFEINAIRIQGGNGEFGYCDSPRRP